MTNGQEKCYIKKVVPILGSLRKVVLIYARFREGVRVESRFSGRRVSRNLLFGKMCEQKPAFREEVRVETRF